MGNLLSVPCYAYVAYREWVFGQQTNSSSTTEGRHKELLCLNRDWFTELLM